MNGGMGDSGLFAVLIVVLLIALVVLAVTATVWLVRSMTVRDSGGRGRSSNETSDS